MLCYANTFTDIPIRFLIGFLMDLKCVRRRRLWVYVLFCILGGVSSVGLTVTDDKVYCVIVWIILQSTFAVTQAQSSTVMTDVVGGCIMLLLYTRESKVIP